MRRNHDGAQLREAIEVTAAGEETEAGWNLAAYKAWLFTTPVQQHLDRRKLAPTAFANLSYAGLLTKP